MNPGIGLVRERLGIGKLSVFEEREKRHPYGKLDNVCPPYHPSSCTLGSIGKGSRKNLNKKPKTQNKGKRARLLKRV